MTPVIVLATTPALARRTEDGIRDEGWDDIQVLTCRTVEEILAQVSDGLDKKTEVLVTLPGPARLVRSILGEKLAILPLEYENVEVVKALIKAVKAIPGGVALGEYMQSSPYLEDIRDLVQQPFTNFLFGNDDDVNIAVLRNLKKKGIGAVVGGGYIANLASEIGFAIFPVEIGSASLRATIKNALEIAAARRYARLSKINMEAIIANQYEAAVSVNMDNMLTLINRSASKLLDIEPTRSLGLPSGDLLPKNEFAAVLGDGKSRENVLHTWNGQGMVCSYRPVLDGDALIGAIATFTTTKEIQKKESLARGYYASKIVMPKRTFEDFSEHGATYSTLVGRARLYARTDETILITGESGTGKEYMAESIHNASLRSGKPFLAINCATFPPGLMESELFGYEAGAFTGARKQGSHGLFEAANGGTLFLDEVGEMPPELQPKLLRALQEKKIRRIGSSWEQAVDVRIIAATNRNLAIDMRLGRFRADLYYRLAVLPLELPRLKDFSGNIPGIARRIFSMLYPGAADDLATGFVRLLEGAKEYPWPGNLRELENVLRRYAALHALLPNMRPGDILDSWSGGDDQIHGSGEDAERISERGQNSRSPAYSPESRQLREVFVRHDGNKTKMAAELGISRTTLWRKLKRFGIC